MKYSANEMTLSGNTPCGSNPINDGRPRRVASNHSSSSSNASVDGKYAHAVLVTVLANFSPHDGAFRARGHAASVTSATSAATASALGQNAHATTTTATLT